MIATRRSRRRFSTSTGYEACDFSAGSLLSLYTRGDTLPDFVDTALKEIDDRLRALKDEAP